MRGDVTGPCPMRLPSAENALCRTRKATVSLLRLPSCLTTVRHESRLTARLYDKLLDTDIHHTGPHSVLSTPAPLEPSAAEPGDP
ncbi:hypothetical protein VTN96DRAFT_6270 [Rasamsonia emersonii]